MNRSALVIVIILAIVFILGAIQIVKDNSAITGGVVTGDDIEEREEKKIAKPPITASLLSTSDDKLFSSELNKILEKDGDSVVVKQTTVPARTNDHKLFLEWGPKLNVLSIYMKKDGPEDSSFEIWGPGKSKVASGSLTNEFRWYNFDVSNNDLGSRSYALFNFGGGDSDIIIDQVLGIPKPESGLAQLTGMIVS